jgi:hypothetical protein
VTVGSLKPLVYGIHQQGQANVDALTYYGGTCTYPIAGVTASAAPVSMPVVTPINPATLAVPTDSLGNQIENGQTITISACALWPTPGYVLAANDPRWAAIDNIIVQLRAKYGANVLVRLRIMAAQYAPYHWVNLCGTPAPAGAPGSYYSLPTLAQNGVTNDPASGNPQSGFTVTPTHGSTSATGGGVPHYYGNSAADHSHDGLPNATMAASYTSGQTSIQVNIGAGNTVPVANASYIAGPGINANAPSSGTVASPTQTKITSVTLVSGTTYTLGLASATTGALTSGNTVYILPQNGPSAGDYDSNGYFNLPTYIGAFWDPAFYTNYISCMKQVIARYDAPTSTAQQIANGWLIGGQSYDFTANIGEIQIGGVETQFNEPFTLGLGFSNGYNAANQSAYQAAGYQEIYRRVAFETIIRTLTNFSQRTRLNFWVSQNAQSAYDTSTSISGTGSVLIPYFYGTGATVPGYHAFATQSPGYTPTPANPTYGYTDYTYTAWLLSTIVQAYGYKVVFGANNLGNSGNCDSAYTLTGVGQAGPALFSTSQSGFIPKAAAGTHYAALILSGGALAWQSTGSGANANQGGSQQTTVGTAFTIGAGTLTVASTTGFSATGNVTVDLTTGGTAVLTYTAKTSTTFTISAVVSGSGTAAVGATVLQAGGLSNCMVNPLAWFAGNNQAWLDYATDGTSYPVNATSLEADPGLFLASYTGSTVYAPNTTALTAAAYQTAGWPVPTLPVTVTGGTNTFTVAATVVTVPAGTYTTRTALMAAVNQGLVTAGLQTRSGDQVTAGFSFYIDTTGQYPTSYLLRSGTTAFTPSAIGASLSTIIYGVASSAGTIGVELPGTWAYANAALKTRSQALAALVNTEAVSSNAAWPMVSVQADFVTNPNTSTTPSYIGLEYRTFAFDCFRGRTFDLGRLEAGQCQYRMDNSDGALDPTNVSALYQQNNQQLLPYRRTRILCLWPSPPAGGNILNSGNAAWLDAPVNQYDSTMEAANHWTNGGPASTYAWQGTNSLSVYGGYTTSLVFPAVPLQPVTVSVYAYLPTGSSLGGLQLSVANVPGASTTMTTIGAWTRISVTFTAQSNTHTMSVGPLTTGTGQFYLDGAMVDVGATTLNPYTTSGSVFYPLWAGGVERYPMSYVAPNQGMSNALAVDLLTPLSQVSLVSAYQSDVLASGAAGFWPLSEGSGSTAFGDTSVYSNPSFLPVQSKYGGGSYSPSGDSSSATSIPSSSTSAVSLVGSGNNGYSLQCLNPPFGFAASGDAFAVSFWFKTTQTGAFLFSASGGGSGVPIMDVSIIAGGYVQVTTYPGGGATPTTGVSQATTVAFNDGNWHQLYLTFGQGTSYIIVDSGATGYTATASTTWVGPAVLNIGKFTLGAEGSPQFTANNYFTGSLCLFAIWWTTTHSGPVSSATTVSATQWNAGALGYSGEDEGARFLRLFRYGGFPSAWVSAQTGISLAGPAVNLQGVTVSAALQSVVDSEAGQMYIDANGILQFKNRYARTYKTSPSFTIGDGPGELPATAALTIDNDPTYVYNRVQITRADGSIVSEGSTASALVYYTRSYSRTINNLADQDGIDLANYLLNRYSAVHPRVERVTLDAAGTPGLFPAVLQFEIGMRIRVNRRPLGAPIVSLDCFIERIEHNVDGQNGTWTVTLDLSPVLENYWLSAPVNTTLSATAAAGSSTLSLNPLADTANLLPSLLWPGQQLIVDPGLATQETVVIGGTTSAGPLPNSAEPSAFTVPVYSLGLAFLLYESVSATTSIIGVGGFQDPSITAASAAKCFLVGTEIMQVATAGSLMQRAFGGSSAAAWPQGTQCYLLNTTTAQSHSSGAVVYESILGTSGLGYTSLQSKAVLGYTSQVLQAAPTTPVTTMPVSRLNLPAPSDGNIPTSDWVPGMLMRLSYAKGTLFEECVVCSIPTYPTTGQYSLDVSRVASGPVYPTNTPGWNGTTITFAAAVTATYLLVGMEIVQVTAGSGTTTLTVVRCNNTDAAHITPGNYVGTTTPVYVLGGTLTQPHAAGDLLVDNYTGSALPTAPTTTTTF